MYYVKKTLMSSTYQVSGNLESNSISTIDGQSYDVLSFGNPVNSALATSGSKYIQSEITIKGSNTNIASSSIMKIQFPQSTLNSNWSCDIDVRSMSETCVALADWVVIKPTNDSASWYIVPRHRYMANQAKLLPVTLSINQTNRTAIISQDASSIDDGSIYYSIKFSFSSGNNETVPVPTFSS